MRNRATMKAIHLLRLVARNGDERIMSTTYDPAQDLAVLAQQEALLRFTEFTPDTAWQLGVRLHDALLARAAGGTVEIERGGQLLFACTTPGAKPDQANWIRRKRNTVRHFARSSYAIGRQLELDHQTLEVPHGLSLVDYAAHGGGFPLFLADMLSGSIIVSGLPQRDDHTLVVTAIAVQLNAVIPQLA
jgi:uncharacterized protein (UPF0303 family)